MAGSVLRFTGSLEESTYYRKCHADLLFVIRGVHTLLEIRQNKNGAHYLKRICDIFVTARLY